MYGYVQFYILLEFEDDTAFIGKVDSDFETPITEDVANYFILKYIQRFEVLGKKTISYNFVSKEAYEKFSEKFLENREFLQSFKVDIN